jgi:AraC-like DNA-binding protein
MNAVTILYSAAAIQGVLLSVLLIRSAVNQPANKLLGLLTSVLAFHLVLVGFDNREFFMRFPHLSRISWIIGTLYWPLLFMFMRELIHRRKTKWVNAIMFLPFLIFLAIMLPWYLQSAEAKRSVITDYETASSADFGWINQTISILHILFQGYFLFYYLRYERNLKDEYSEIERFRVKWLKKFLWFVFIITTIAVFSFFARNFNWPLLSQLYQYHFLGVVLLFFWLSFNALTKPVLFGLHEATENDSKAPTITPQSEKRPTETDRSQEIFSQIRLLMEEEHLYRKKDLTLTELSQIVGVPRNLVSHAINTHYSGNFFDLVNDFRVEAFKAMLHEPAYQHMNLLGIAQEAGFNSKATFYSTFRKKTGKTPSEFADTKG